MKHCLNEARATDEFSKVCEQVAAENHMAAASVLYEDETFELKTKEVENA